MPYTYFCRKNYSSTQKEVQMADTDVFIRTSDAEAGEMLRKLAEMEKRSMGNQVAILIREEWARRFSKPTWHTLDELTKLSQAGQE
jgi:hypothetical protein